MEEGNSRSGEDDDTTTEDERPATQASLPSATRLQRNQAEKVRRDKLSHYVNQLADLLPMVPATGKKPHRTNVLRYAAVFLRIKHLLAANEMLERCNMLPISEECWNTILEGMEGIFLVVTASGKIVYLSKSVEGLLGHQQLDLLGTSLFSLTYLEDHEVLKTNLRYDPTETISGGLSAKKSFFIRLKQRAASKGDQPNYEPVHIVGQLKIPQQPPTTPTSREVALLGQSSGPSMEPILVAVVMPFKEKRVTDTSLLEANRDEWISRHLIDGKIIYSDHRISFSSGYLAEEVTGVHAFRYMHKDDVRWVMIALRQMYLHGETYGSSCYRLQIKTGKFMYLKTRGYLESGDANSVQSFICINTPVSEAEGQRLIAEMQRQLAPLLEKEPELSISPLIDKRNKASTSKEIEEGTLDDPEDLNQAIEELLSNLPEDEIRAQPSSPAPDELFEKVATVSKVLPPAIVQSSRVGVSPPSLKKASPATPQPQQRPSVLRFNSTDKAKRTVNEEQSPGSAKRPRPTHTSVIVSEPTRPTTTSVIQTNTSPPNPAKQSFVVSLPVADSPIDNVIEETFIFPTDVFPVSPLDEADIPTQFQDFPEDYETTLQIPVVESEEVLLNSIWTSDTGQLEVNVMQGHQQLEDSIEKQVRQIISIEHDLASVPPFHTNKYRNTFSNLKAEHWKQKEILKTLQHDHQSIQRPSTSGLSKRQLQLSHQDIGV